MNTNFLQNILLEVAIDNRVPTGMVDINNILHREILAEKLIDHGIDQKTTMEVVNRLALKDGKYPDRQAYNKDGWLVTFPTPEHKNAAIKKKTAFSSDPTHGSGGMHLYYKSKGKQSRQKTQGTSEVGGETEQPSTSTQQKSDSAVAPEQPAQQPAQQSVQSELPKSGEKTSQATSQPTTKVPSDVVSSEVPVDDSGSTKSDVVDSPKTDAPASATSNTDNGPTVTAKPDPKPTTSPIIKLSVEFARSKSWRDAPYGDWTNDRGEQIAVTGLDGQVVPIRFVDREELKSFAEKRMSDGINLHEEFRRLKLK